MSAAKVLANKVNRQMLIELSQAGFARGRDVLSRKGKAKDEVEAALEQLKSAQLVNSEYLLECRRAGTPLTRLTDSDDLNVESVGKLKCPTCGSMFRDELLSEGFSLSDLGRKLSSRSYWMTVWVTDQLVRIGVPLAGIAWNLTASGEEVDLLVEFLGGLWIFELKDREFGAGDAHPFNYRQVRYKADAAVIITTEHVSKDAKKVFEELAKEAAGGRLNPVYIEGLDKADSVLRTELAAASRRYAYRRIQRITEPLGYDFRPILEALFGELPKSEPEGFERVFVMAR